jgi:branched-chain amino acid transport system permease protein
MGVGKKMTTALILQAIVSGLLLGGVYSLICVGLTLTFGVMRIINFAHGEFLMVAMYATYFFAVGFKTEPYAAIVVVLPALFLFGVFVFHFLIRPIQSRDPLNQMLLLVGLSLVLQKWCLSTILT